MKKAFKEWAVICRALATGRQVLILRKGGTSEETGKFRPEFREFLLLPTGFHQAPDHLLPEAQTFMREAEAEQPTPGRVSFSHYAVVTDAIRVETPAALRALRSEHIWSDTVVEERFHRWQEDGVHALIVRVFALPNPVGLEMKESYAGCKSWVNLDVDVPINGAAPVLSDEAFADRRAAIQKVLCTTHGKSE